MMMITDDEHDEQFFSISNWFIDKEANNLVYFSMAMSAVKYTVFQGVVYRDDWFFKRAKLEHKEPKSLFTWKMLTLNGLFMICLSSQLPTRVPHAQNILIGNAMVDLGDDCLAGTIVSHDATSFWEGGGRPTAHISKMAWRVYGRCYSNGETCDNKHFFFFLF